MEEYKLSSGLDKFSHVSGIVGVWDAVLSSCKIMRRSMYDQIVSFLGEE